jgi:RNA polymerase sigma-70 factor (ECF subfamily)
MSHFHGLDISAEVVRAARAGEPAAYEAIYRLYQRPIYTLIRRLISRPALADDLFQETFVEVLRSIGAYTGEGSFGGWVRRIAVSKCLMYLRSPWHRHLNFFGGASDDEPDESQTLPDPGPRPDLAAEASFDLERALEALPDITRSVVWLHDVEGYTHGEIGRLLGRTTSFSKSQLARAHVRLRELLEPTAVAPSASPGIERSKDPLSSDRIVSTTESLPEQLPCTPVSTSF